MKKKKSLKMPEIFIKAEKALRLAVKDVLAEHRLRGLPIYVWQNNKVVKIPAHRIPK
jgi:hypothetical protein